MSDNFDDDLPDEFGDLIKNYELTARFALIRLGALRTAQTFGQCRA